MDNEMEKLAKNLADSVGKSGGINFEKLVGLLSSESGKRILASLLSDGGVRVKKAAELAKNGDMSGVGGIISSIAATEEGRELLLKLSREKK